MLSFMLIILFYFLPDIVLRLDPLLGGYHRKFMDRAYQHASPLVKIFVTYIPYFRYYKGALLGYGLLWEGLAQPFFEELLFFALPLMISPQMLMASAIIWALLHVGLHSLPYVMFAPLSRRIVWVILQLVGWGLCGLAISSLWLAGLGALSITIHVIVNTISTVMKARAYRVEEIKVEETEDTYFPKHEEYFPAKPETGAEYLTSSTSAYEWIWGKERKTEKKKKKEGKHKTKIEENEENTYF